MIRLVSRRRLVFGALCALLASSIAPALAERVPVPALAERVPVPALAERVPVPALAGDTPAEALAKMVDRARELGPRAAYLFDLDETLVDSTPRRFASIREALDRACREDPSAGRPGPAACRNEGRALDIRRLYELRNRYDIAQFLAESGYEDETFAKEVEEDAFAIYLSGAYVVEKDRLYPGAQAFVRELKDAGARVYYVTSRPSAAMRAPTLEFLRRRGLIRAGEEDRLVLREGSGPSVPFKRQAAERIRAEVEADGGRVVGLFENEPRNLSAWAEAIPGARAFFVLGAYEQNSTIPAKSVILEDFRF